jgi:hypothetical protein
MAMANGGGLDGGDLKERDWDSLGKHRLWDRAVTDPAAALRSSCIDPASDLLSTTVGRCDWAGITCGDDACDASTLK